PEEMLNKIYEDKETGFSSIFSGGVTIGIMGIIFMGIINIISGLFKLDLDFLPPLLYFIIIFLPAYYATHMLVFRKDKYVKYFYEFEKKSRIWKRSWAWISLAFLITSIAFFYASMVIRGHLVHS
ncbi:MAG: hypothetical protein LIO93_11745, partial [Bacteroidales bacterium]|nr:hypothetical protein [Bacteroidales bacterium]